MPPPPHVSGGTHVPQLNVPPHPFGHVPHVYTSAPHVVGVQLPPPHVPVTPPPPHVSGAVHVPQLIELPHPSGQLPHEYPSAAHVVGVHGDPTHAPALQYLPVGHVPHVIVPPHPSGHDPHVYPSAPHVVGVHVGGGGGTVSSHTRDARSKNMNSSAVSCGVSAVVVLHPLGNGLFVTSPAAVWMSLKTNRPQTLSEAAPTGVLKETY
jgi:hypothetical protein